MCTLNLNLTLTLMLSTIKSVQWSNPQQITQLYTVNFKSNVSASLLYLYSPRVDQSASWLTARWFVSEWSSSSQELTAAVLLARGGVWSKRRQTKTATCPK